MTCAVQDVEDIHNVLSVMQKNLECPICLDLMKEPVATRCDHIFCRFCMLQLLGKKKKGRAQCPMCKKEITKRSLQESPRFKLLIDGLMKIINAFELDSGYKFFPSQDYSKSVTVNCKETQKEDDQTVVHSTGYRNRNKRCTFTEEQCIDTVTLLETRSDVHVSSNTGTRICRRAKRKKETKPLISAFVSDSSEDDLLEKAGSLGDDDDDPYLGSKYIDSVQPHNGDENILKICNTNDHISLKSEAEDVVASDLAEYGFSERDLESTRSLLLCMDGLSTLKEISSEKVSRSHLLSEQNLHVNADENNTLSKNTENTSMQLENHLHDKRQTLKTLIDSQYDKDESLPEDIGSSQGSPGDVSTSVSRKRMKRSIQRVNEWLMKTTEILNSALWDEELLTEVFPAVDHNESDRGSCTSDETEIMTVTDACVGEKTAVNMEDKVFGKVYRRDRRSSLVLKVTCVADVHADSTTNKLKVDELPNAPSGKRKRKTDLALQPEDFIKRVQPDDLHANHPDIAPVTCTKESDKSRYKTSNCEVFGFDEIRADVEDLETFSDDETKPKKQKKSLGKKCPRAAQSLSLVTRTDVASFKPQTPLPSSDLKIDSYPSSTEPHEAKQQNVRRSKRNKQPENPVPTSARHTATGASGGEKNTDMNQCELDIVDSSTKTATLKMTKHGIPTNGPDLVSNILLPNARADTGNESEESWHTTAETVEHMVNKGDTEDSELDTQHLLKTFKSAKRMSFKLDAAAESADKENFDPVNMSDVGTNQTNGFPMKAGNDIPASTGNLLGGENHSKSDLNENIEPQSKEQSLMAMQSTQAKKLLARSKKIYRCSSENNGKRTAENSDDLVVPETGQLNDGNAIKGTQLLGKSLQEKIAAVSKSEALLLHSQTESLCSYPEVTHESPVAGAKSNTSEGVNEQGINCDQEQNCDEGPAHEMTPANVLPDSMTERTPCKSAPYNSSPDRSPDVYSDTPDGLLGGVGSCQAVADKSFVFGKKSHNLESPSSCSQVTRTRKRQAQKLQSSSSDDDSSGDDDVLPCFNAFLYDSTNATGPKNASAGSSPKLQGGGVLAMFSSCSTSGKTQTSWNLPQESLLCSQESQCSVNLFSSQSNTSDHSVNGGADHKLTCGQNRTQENSPKRARENMDFDDLGQMEPDMNDFGEPNQEQNLDEVSACESEASHTGDSSGLSSQCEILNTQQREAMQNDLEKLQREMAALEAVLEQHGTQSPASESEQVSTAEHVIIRPREARHRQTDLVVQSSSETISETKGQVAENTFPDPQIRSTTPNSSSPSNPEGKKLNDSTPSNSAPKFSHSCNVTHEPALINNATAPPKPSLGSTPQGRRQVTVFSTPKIGKSRLPLETRKHQKTNTQRSSSPTFASPASRMTPSVKSPVVSSRRNFSIVASGLSQNERVLVQKFARKTQSIFSSEMTSTTSHVIMKTDEDMVCERTLKYFRGIAGRKWVVSYQWIVQSFREGRILDEYDFEVRGDVINGRNHRGPRRSRLGSDGLLLADFEVCCLGSFKDLSREDLESIVSLCGASVVHEPLLFKRTPGTTSLVIVQPDGQTDYTAMRKKHRAQVVTREWLLDSVASYKLQTFDSYLL